MKKSMKQQKTNNDRHRAETDELATAVVRANQGDASALAAVRQMLKEFPTEAIDLLEGDLAKQAETQLVSMVAGRQLAFREALYAKLQALRNELSGRNLSPIERLLVERVVACWLQVHAADALFAQAEQVTLAEGDYLQRRQERAHRRYLSALKMLAVVRRLALPIRVDVNVARIVETKAAEPVTSPLPWWSPEYPKN